MIHLNELVMSVFGISRKHMRRMSGLVVTFKYVLTVQSLLNHSATAASDASHVCCAADAFDCNLDA